MQAGGGLKLQLGGGQHGGGLGGGGLGTGLGGKGTGLTMHVPPKHCRSTFLILNSLRVSPYISAC